MMYEGNHRFILDLQKPKHKRHISKLFLMKTWKMVTNYFMTIFLPKWSIGHALEVIHPVPLKVRNNRRNSRRWRKAIFYTPTTELSSSLSSCLTVYYCYEIYVNVWFPLKRIKTKCRTDIFIFAPFCMKRLFKKSKTESGYFMLKGKLF